MSGRYSAYPAYGPSVAEWQEDVPAGWNSLALGRIFRRVKRSGFSDEELLSVYRDHGVIPKASRDDNFNNASEDLSPYQLVRPGDLVMNKMKAWQGSIAMSEHRGIVSPAYFVYEAWRRDDDRMESKYIHYLLRSPAYITQYLSRSKGIRVNQWDLDPGAFERIEVLLPSLEEQTRIAKFLDYETAKIDALIEKQQQLIALLKEKRQAVISHAVTKGLNPDAPRRDSGVEWLGEVPAHWEVGALGYYASLNTGATPDRSKPGFWSGDIPWVKTGEVNYEPIYETEEQISEAGLRNSAVRVSPPGTLLMAMYGQGVTRGRVAVLGIPATYNQACVAINPGSTVTSTYLRYFFMSAYHAIRDGGNVTSQMNLNADIVKSFKIAIPPSNEQLQIAGLLDDKLPKFKRLLERSETAIQVMMERRTALISAAVTGKIDVRGWQAPESETKAEVA